MSVSVRDLVGMPSLALSVVAGHEGLENSIRWAHTSELADPTPWMSGGELLLTTGMGLGLEEEALHAYVERLVGAHVSALGVGVGFRWSVMPAAFIDTARRHRLPLLEVPYEVPFLAIAEAVSTRLSEDRLKEARMSVEVHDRLAGLVSEGAGPADVLDEVTALAGGWAVLFDSRGGVIALSAPGPSDPPPSKALWDRLPPGLIDFRGPIATSEVSPRGTQVGVAVTAGKRQEGILVFGKDRRLTGHDRIVVRHAVTVLGLLLASRRAVSDAQRRVTGDTLSEGFMGRLAGADLERRLELVGFPGDTHVTALVVESGPPGGADIEELAEALDWTLGMRCRTVRAAVVGERAAALVDHEDPKSLGHAIAAQLPSLHRINGSPPVRVGVGESVSLRSVRHSYLSAVFALRAAPQDRVVASLDDLGSYGFLLGAQPRPVLEGFVRSVIGPLLDRDHERSSALVDSVAAYIEAGGRWEAGAEALGVHRHTLRYRVRQAEDLLARDLSSPEDRLEVWLAIKAVEILRE
jgi:PucR family transcriptional regulator, purine catabolism regulatory protein